MAALICVAAATLIGGCQVIRKVTYPPEFVYIEKGQLTSSMHQLANLIVRTEQLADDPQVSAPQRRDSILANLSEMEDIAFDLGAGTDTTNHLLLDQNIDEFVADIRRARAAVAEDPPDYYLTGQISGSCLACHRLR